MTATKYGIIAGGMAVGMAAIVIGIKRAPHVIGRSPYSDGEFERIASEVVAPRHLLGEPIRAAQRWTDGLLNPAGDPHDQS
jgi:hypothetical protein